MDNFECSVKDLKDTDVLNDVDLNKQPRIMKEKHKNNEENKNENVNNFITTAFLNKLNETRSIRIIFTILIMYLILNSEYVGGLFFNMFPYLMNSATESNLFGKILISLFISISVILSISS
jgi:hypothetical protein